MALWSHPSSGGEDEWIEISVLDVANSFSILTDFRLFGHLEELSR
jgi:hypothetical protein